MKLVREDFIKVLTSLKPGIAKREIIEQGDRIVFDCDDESVYTFNEQIACYRNYKTDIKGAVNAELLLDLLEKLPDDEIDFSQDEEGNIIIKCKKSVSSLNCDTQIRLPIHVLEKPEESSWLLLPETFNEIVDVVEDCVSTSDTDFQLSSIHITPNYIEAANENQVCRYNIELPIETPFLVRHGSLKSIKANNVTHFAITPKWLHFKNEDGLRISCHRYEEDYIESVNIIIEKERKGTEIVLPAGLKDAVLAASLFSKDSNTKYIGVQFNKDKQKVTILGEGINGYHKNSHKIEYNGENMQFSILPQLFLELINQYKTCELCSDCLKFANETYTYITSLEPLE
jgi:DNA polymerase III sliding clamp (beta) subunit (PCNA family)